MRRAPIAALALTLSVPLIAVAQDAPPSPSIAYQGRLVESGQPVSGARVFSFTILDAHGNPVWASGPATLQVASGLYATTLGVAPMPEIPATVLGMAGLKLRVQVGSKVLTPDMELVPALQARSAFQFTGALEGDVQGTQAATVLMALQGKPLDLLSAPPRAGQALVYDGSRWTAATGGTGVSGVTGAAPIASSGGTTPVISIAPASTSAAGSMSAADKSKLDAFGGAGAYATSGANTNITSLGSLTTPLSVGQGGTGANTAPAGLAALGGAPLSSPTFTGTVTAPTLSTETIRGGGTPGSVSIAPAAGQGIDLAGNTQVDGSLDVGRDAAEQNLTVHGNVTGDIATFSRMDGTFLTVGSDSGGGSTYLYGGSTFNPLLTLQLSAGGGTLPFVVLLDAATPTPAARAKIRLEHPVYPEPPRVASGVIFSGLDTITPSSGSGPDLTIEGGAVVEGDLAVTGGVVRRGDTATLGTESLPWPQAYVLVGVRAGQPANVTPADLGRQVLVTEAGATFLLDATDQFPAGFHFKVTNLTATSTPGAILVRGGDTMRLLNRGLTGTPSCVQVGLNGTIVLTKVEIDTWTVEGTVEACAP